jgi:hypothetical protein
VNCLSGAPLYGGLLIRRDSKGLPGTNTLAYYDHLYVTSVKSFMTFCSVDKMEETDTCRLLGAVDTAGAAARHKRR